MTAEPREPTAAESDPLERVLQRIAVFSETDPEEDESWESWYRAAFDMLHSEVRALRAAASERSTADGVAVPVAYASPLGLKDFAENPNTMAFVSGVKGGEYTTPLYTAPPDLRQAVEALDAAEDLISATFENLTNGDGGEAADELKLIRNALAAIRSMPAPEER